MSTLEKNREQLRKAQAVAYELIDYFLGIKKPEAEKYKNYQRAKEDDENLLWTLRNLRYYKIKPLQDEYMALIAQFHYEQQK